MDPGELKTTAELASLSLAEGELSSLGGELEKMLGCLSKMGLAGDAKSPSAHGEVRPARLRRDEESRDINPDALLENAPEREDRFVVIPNVL